MLGLFHLLILFFSVTATRENVGFKEEIGEILRPGMLGVNVSVTETSEIVKYQAEISKILRPRFLAETLAHGKWSQCQVDFIKVLLDASIFHKGYALKLLDATAKIPDGLAVGNHYYMGQFYECLSVEHPKGRFYGKYCSLFILNSEGEPLIPGLSYVTGFCAPSSCSSDDLNNGFYKISKKLILATNEDLCLTAYDNESFTDLDKFAISVIIILCLLACFSTTYEVYQRKILKNEKPKPLFSSFSLYQNGKALFEVRETGGGQMDCLHGIRTISTLWVILCHVPDFTAVSNSNNSADSITAAINPDYIVINGGYLSVDTFFFLSGLLVTFVFFRDIGKTGSYDVPRSYINRFIRLTPPYAMTILLQVTIINYLGSGPLWNTYMGSFSRPCNDYWWTSLLYVQNIVNPDQLCLSQTWYLSADMQMYWIAPLLLYPLYFWPKIGAGFVVVVALASAFCSFAISFVNDLAYAPVVDTTGVESSLEYYVAWTRASPWLVGILLGFVICGLKAKKIEVNLKPMHVVCGWLLSIALLASCMFSIIWFFKNPEYAASTESAAYVAFHRAGWALGLAILVFLCINGYGGPINAFLSWSFFQVLAKMSYCAYLVHISAILAVSASFTTTLHFNLETVFFLNIGVTIYTHLAAILLSLLVEMPVSNLDRIYLRSVKIFPFPRGKPAVERKSRQPLEGQLPTVMETKEVEEGMLQEEFSKQQN